MEFTQTKEEFARQAMLSIGYIVNALIARFWLGETLSAGGWSGIALICCGVWLIARQA